jgi:hypothetical protein
MIPFAATEVLDPDSCRAALRALYDELDATLAALGPVCQLSGRCCRFADYGHTLFLSAAEAALLVADAPPPPGPLDAPAACPWQDGQGRCTARDARPLGCRVFYCDPRWESALHRVSEQFLGRLKRLTEARGWPWNYAPLHHHLRAAAAAGRFPPPRAENPARAPAGGAD